MSCERVRESRLSVLIEFIVVTGSTKKQGCGYGDCRAHRLVQFGLPTRRSHIVDLRTLLLKIGYGNREGLKRAPGLRCESEHGLDTGKLFLCECHVIAHELLEKVQVGRIEPVEPYLGGVVVAPCVVHTGHTSHEAAEDVDRCKQCVRDGNRGGNLLMISDALEVEEKCLDEFCWISSRH